MTAQDIITAIKEAGAETNQEIADALCDSALLFDLGVADADQEAVEEAYSIVTQ